MPTCVGGFRHRHAGTDRGRAADGAPERVLQTTRTTGHRRDVRVERTVVANPEDDLASDDTSSSNSTQRLAQCCRTDDDMSADADIVPGSRSVITSWRRRCSKRLPMRSGAGHFADQGMVADESILPDAQCRIPEFLDLEASAPWIADSSLNAVFLNGRKAI